MFDLLKTRFEAFERRMTRRHGTDLTVPGARRVALLHFHLMDHAFLRILWTNLEQIAPGVWRSNHPSAARLRRYREMGIRTVISLRGPRQDSHRLLEEEACAALGLRLETVTLKARRLVPRENLLALLDLFDRAERPMVMHCKSGSDRAGFASALYLIHAEGAPVARARTMLSWRYLHSRRSKAGVLDVVLDRFEADCAKTPMTLRDWIATRYDPAAIESAFRAERR
ncbi:protein tyrosine phosphatase [Rhodovulum sp. BSW8]|uniref:Tyrosine phosphatase family protein n=1 Tax=Rhodovulum visakhapatnamense TaxID=364297 RepID=A0A4V3GSK9_9RHOB|nr:MULTISPECIES: tyrosine-protein phosphatase [Rhodovulum]RBO54257.1 protein tyrosine phosphatase [Rhodovulum sp. BSW8]TDX23263.1 tyrosine phosphatase family protein [Rhodovulum visakhapatnamense]